MPYQKLVPLAHAQKSIERSILCIWKEYYTYFEKDVGTRIAKDGAGLGKRV